MSQFFGSNFYSGMTAGSIFGPVYGTAPTSQATPPAKPEIGPSQQEQTNLPMIPRMSGPNSYGPLVAATLGSGQGCNGSIPLMMGGTMYGWNPGGMTVIPPAWGEYATYRLMDDHPTNTLARQLFIDPICAAPFTAEGIDDSVPPEWVDEVKNQLLPQMGVLLPAALVCMGYGWAPFEKIWTKENGTYTLRLRPIQHDHTLICLDKNTGNFAGLQVAGPDNFLGLDKCWVATNRPHVGMYGHRVYDAAYEAFVSWMQSRSDQRKLRAKIAGILPILFYPPGSTIVNGVIKDNGDVANIILQQIGMGTGTAMPSEQFSAQDIARDPKLASTSLWRLEFYDAGSLTPAQEGILKELTYDDVLMFRAWGMPERSGMEGHHGTRAEAGVHSDNSITGKELVANSVADQMTAGNRFTMMPGLADDILRYNFGPQAVGKVRLKAPPLADAKLDPKLKAFLSLMSSTNVPLTTGIVKSTNIDNWMRDIGIPDGDEPFDVGEYDDAMKLKSAQEATAAALAAAPKPVQPTNGNGAVKLARETGDGDKLMLRMQQYMHLDDQ